MNDCVIFKPAKAGLNIKNILLPQTEEYYFLNSILFTLFRLNIAIKNPIDINNTPSQTKLINGFVLTSIVNIPADSFAVLLIPPSSDVGAALPELPELLSEYDIGEK